MGNSTGTRNNEDVITELLHCYKDYKTEELKSYARLFIVEVPQKLMLMV